MPGELIEIVFIAATADSGPIHRHGRNPGTYHVRLYLRARWLWTVATSSSRLQLQNNDTWGHSVDAGGGRARGPAAFCGLFDA